MKQKNTSLSGESLCKAIEKGKSLKIPGGIYDKSVKNLLTVLLVPTIISPDTEKRVISGLNFPL